MRWTSTNRKTESNPWPSNAPGLAHLTGQADKPAGHAHQQAVRSVVGESGRRTVGKRPACLQEQAAPWSAPIAHHRTGIGPQAGAPSNTSLCCCYHCATPTRSGWVSGAEACGWAVSSMGPALWDEDAAPLLRESANEGSKLLSS